MDIPSDNQTTTLQCLDIWGGNKRADEVVSSSNIDVWIYSNPQGASDEGGDIHYVSACSQGVLTRISLADVSGHGVGASQLARNLHKLMQDHINALDHSDFVRSLNDEFGKISSGGHFATALISAYYAPTCQMVICNVGHPKPLKYCGGAGGWMFLDGGTSISAAEIENLPFGIIEGTSYSQFTVDLGADDIIVLYSDALIESKNAAGQQLGETGFLNLMRTVPTHDPHLFNERVIGGVGEFRAGAAADDDETILTIRRRSQPATQN